MTFKKHPNFNDVAWLVEKIGHYKAGFVDIKFYWVNLKGERTFYSKSKVRLKISKWREFKNYEPIFYI